MKIGFTELIVIFIVALFVIGPDQLPEFARKLGEGLATFRKYSSEATKDIKESIVEPLEEAQRPLREAMAPVEELKQEVEGNIKEVKASISGIGKPKKESGSGTADAQKREDEKQDAPAASDTEPTGESDAQPELIEEPQSFATTESATAEESGADAASTEYLENSINEGENVI
ncbi:MAG: twin-arginine translocase TatA/TatE family subunit [Clostridiales bacterium]|nr:twin-arginine translocase TatA/TatE family subunit [Clostridiales bacterium]